MSELADPTREQLVAWVQQWKNTAQQEAKWATEAMRERDAYRALLLKLDACMKGHLIGVNCKGPVLDDETVEELRSALAARKEPDA